MIYWQKPQKSKTTKTALKRKTNMKNYIRGFIFCAMWYLSIIAGFFLLVCPILPLVIISPKRYRKWSDVIFGMWEPFPVAMMEVCFGIRVVLSGDKINPFEGSLFVMNHRTRVDWNFLWLGLFHCCQPNAHNMKYILKAPIMHFPGPGWVMQTCSFIFVHRNWAKDKPLLDNILDYLNESDSLYQILLFPEGTDLTEKNIKKSHKYADDNNLERYYKVLHPRTTGFAFIASKMKSGGQLKAIYDVTIAYPKTMPLTEGDIALGKFPEEVHFHVKRYSSFNIPYEEEELKTWLNNIWREKEGKLQRFYATGSFTNNGEGEGPLYNLSDQDIDFGKMSIKNGVIKYDMGGSSNSNVEEISVVSVGRRSVTGGSTKPSTFNIPRETASHVTSESHFASPIVSSKSSPLATSNSGSEPVVRTEGINSTKVVTDAREAMSGESSKTSTSNALGKSNLLSGTESETYARNHVSCEEVYRSQNYRPSHLLYLVLVFWITLIILTIHLLYCNIYLQIWVLTHSLLFTALSFVSNGFHHVAAAVYFYRYDRKPSLVKKSE